MTKTADSNEVLQVSRGLILHGQELDFLNFSTVGSSCIQVQLFKTSEYFQYEMYVEPLTTVDI